MAVDRAGRAGVGGELAVGADGADVVLGEELGVGQGDRGAADVGVARALGNGGAQGREGVALGGADQLQG